MRVGVGRVPYASLYVTVIFPIALSAVISEICWIERHLNSISSPSPSAEDVNVKLFPLVKVKLNVKVCQSVESVISLITPSLPTPREMPDISRLART